ncbi:Ubiquitin thioesterase otubain-like [Tetrabaena socialis]|uniref:ubiquitinyl hydrolase 1 n=1 Tax=Tetrabaena socialis TaxID=47790 RepID=A0A2J8A656_9CHLO|nr:Ubiquitin thioesterase otubain-like [Tetrabaena socialis]|eukprot:PNH07985.1 Ubiquitin thioesterase otubain-like [Tetrabaena socialis]
MNEGEGDAAIPPIEAGPAPPPAAPERPSDEDILAQQNLLRAEQAQRSEYVGNEEPLSALKEEYINGNQNFVSKIQKLEATYKAFRRTRGDGNCFYRGLVFAYLEGLLLNQDMAECERFTSVVQSWKGRLVEGGFQELVFEDAMELLLDQVKAVRKPQSDFGHEGLLINMRDDMVSNMIVMFLRLVTSCEVQLHEDRFFPFILGMYDEPPATVELFCQRYVEPMGEESDHLHIVAVAEALQIPVRVVYLDSSGAPSGGGSGLEVTTHDFVPDSCPPGTTPRVHLLYRPGHYDILYPR